MMLNVEVEFLLMHFDFQYLESIEKHRIEMVFFLEDFVLTIGGVGGGGVG